MPLSSGKRFVVAMTMRNFEANSGGMAAKNSATRDERGPLLNSFATYHER